jgi:hypothetical protein
LLQATAMMEAKPEILLWRPKGTRFSNGTSEVCRPKPRRAFAVDVEQLTTRRILSLRVSLVECQLVKGTTAKHTHATMMTQSSHHSCRVRASLL